MRAQPLDRLGALSLSNGQDCAPTGHGAGPSAAGHERRRYAGVEWLAAALFALHPVHVASVAWITEQKNTFSLILYLAAFLLYLRFDEARRPRYYFFALALFGLSILAKTATVIGDVTLGAHSRSGSTTSCNSARSRRGHRT